MTPLLIVSVAFVATFLSSLSGGGTGIITVPVWLALGAPLPTAIACNKINAVLWVLFPARNYLRSEEIDWPLLAGMGAVGLGGAYFGSTINLAFDEALLRRILGGVLIGLAFVVTVDRSRLEGGRIVGRSRAGAFLAALPLGCYEAFFGTGNGVFSTLALARLRGFNLIRALGHYYCLAFLWSAFAAIVYVRAGYFNFNLVFFSSVGAMLGGHLGSLVGKRKGVTFIRRVFASCALLFGSLLLLGKI